MCNKTCSTIGEVVMPKILAQVQCTGGDDNCGPCYLDPTYKVILSKTQNDCLVLRSSAKSSLASVNSSAASASQVAPLAFSRTVHNSVVIGGNRSAASSSSQPRAQTSQVFTDMRAYNGRNRGGVRSEVKKVERQVVRSAPRFVQTSGAKSAPRSVNRGSTSSQRATRSGGCGCGN